MNPPEARAADADELALRLRERFGLNDFRPWQREAIDAVLGAPGKALVVAPTGGGKSLTYQFPATELPGTTLVVSPLVALMEDQVQSLQARGIEATYLAATLEPELRRERERWMRRGRYKLVYVAPERLQYDGFIETCTASNIGLLAVDEAHCISMWGHDFRPEYLRIGELIGRLNPPRIIACTATATPDVRREILERLGLVDGEVKVVLRGFARPNLHLAAQSVDGPAAARERVRSELQRVLGDPRRPAGGAIVYAATRKQVEVVADDLRRRGWNASPYHAGLDAETRTELSTRFSRREVDVVVATNAFGMGIDRADIRTVIHHQPPSSIEAYYQEVGRAGRDGREAHGLLLMSGADIALRRRLVQLGFEGEEVDPAVAARAWRQFRELLRYLDAGTCRHDFILRYFGDEQEILGGCGHCDVCASLDEVADDDAQREEATLVARKALAGVARAKGRAGTQAIAEMLRGVSTPRTERFGFTRLSTFGLLRDASQDWVVAVLRGLIAAGWIDLTPTDHPVPLLTASGGKAMRSTEGLRFRLPPQPRARSAARSGAKSRPSVEFDRELFERLRAWRAETARRLGYPAYVVAFDRTLEEVAARTPLRVDDLAGITGLGAERIRAYGDGLVGVVRAGLAS
ncbi:MAG: ATP-dependent DNA helicase RecQ [Polyangiales bacterium]